jgi:hypothetical protein
VYNIGHCSKWFTLKSSGKEHALATVILSDKAHQTAEVEGVCAIQIDGHRYYVGKSQVDCERCLDVKGEILVQYRPYEAFLPCPENRLGKVVSARLVYGKGLGPKRR